MPVEERLFCEAVSDAADGYGYARDDASALGALAAARNETVGRFKPDAWTGTLDRIERSSGGLIVAVRLPCKATLRTTNNFVSDAARSSLVPADSPVADVLRILSIGQRVKFDAELLLTKGAATELSLTRRGSLTSPEFLARFVSIEAAP